MNRLRLSSAGSYLACYYFDNENRQLTQFDLGLLETNATHE